MKLKNWKNELKYLEELGNTSTYKEDTSGRFSLPQIDVH
jgi:hypothetical protein